jgi:hypothetical protein
MDPLRVAAGPACFVLSSVVGCTACDAIEGGIYDMTGITRAINEHCFPEEHDSGRDQGAPSGK